MTGLTGEHLAAFTTHPEQASERDVKQMATELLRLRAIEQPGRDYLAAPPPNYRWSGCPIIRQFADDLTNRPGEWTVWPKPQAPKSAASTARHVNLGTYRALPNELFEAKSVNRITYVRYRKAAE